MFGMPFKVTYCKNLSKFDEKCSIFTGYIAQTNIQSDRQTNFKLSHGNKNKNVTYMKKSPFKLQKQQKIY